VTDKRLYYAFVDLEMAFFKKPRMWFSDLLGSEEGKQ
jgi:hypothetical protein